MFINFLSGMNRELCVLRRLVPPAHVIFRMEKGDKFTYQRACGGLRSAGLTSPIKSPASNRKRCSDHVLNRGELASQQLDAYFQGHSEMKRTTFELEDRSINGNYPFFWRHPNRSEILALPPSSPKGQQLQWMDLWSGRIVQSRRSADASKSLAILRRAQLQNA
jgi:hypothetical protein